VDIEVITDFFDHSMKKDGKRKNKNIDGRVKPHDFHDHRLASRLLGS
jgi:hypothetical protein